MQLSKIEKIDLREIWKHEASDFTSWLARKENLDLLSEEIGIDISLIQTEASVGKFHVDILAEEENTGRKIIIENQLETTNHDHLGKIITYASGYDAEIIIWIVRSVRDEHKQAIDWLNEHTDDKINLFAIQMELWRIADSRIADSPCAPKFQIIAKPNDWAKATKTSTGRSGELSDTQMTQLEFWTKFKEYVRDQNVKVRIKKPFPQNWTDISFGFSTAYINLTVNSQTNQIGCEVYIPESKELFRHLYDNKEKIEEEMDCGLRWDELRNRKASRIKLIKDADLSILEEWDGIHKWLLEYTIRFQDVFSKYIKKYNNR